MMLDLNGFKQLNDRHGHRAGDEALKAFAEELAAQFRPLDAVGRWGGDEFLVLFDAALPEISARVAAVRRWICGQYSLSCGKVALSAAIGCVRWTAGRLPADTVAEADAAMYRDKSS